MSGTVEDTQDLDEQLDEPVSIVGEVAPEFVDSQYIEPLKVAMEIWDLQKQELRYSYDSFNAGSAGNDITVTGCSVTPPGASQHGSFSFIIHDTDKVIEPRHLRRA